MQVGSSQRRLDSLLTSGASVMRRIEEGRGSLGLLVNDPSLYRNADSLAVMLRILAADIRANPRRYVNVRIF